MARLCEELGVALLAAEALPDSLLPALLTSLPGTSCLSVFLVGAGGQALWAQPLMEAGSIRRGPLPSAPVASDTAAWRCFSTGKTLRGRDAVCSASKAQFRDWATAHQKYGATVFLTLPLEVSAGIIGVLQAAGGPKMDGKAVQALAGRLAEVVMRRTLEGLLKVASSELEATASDAAARLSAAFPQVMQRGDGAPPAVDLQCRAAEASRMSTAPPAPSSGAASPGGSTGSGSSKGGMPSIVSVSPFASIAAAASQQRANSGSLSAQTRESPRSEASSMRPSSFEQYQELRYFCLHCRAENCVDLPQWHWGQMVDHLVASRGRRHSSSLSAATAPAVSRSSRDSGEFSRSTRFGDDSVGADSHMVASTGMARMARLAAICARDDDDDNVCGLSMRNSDSTRVHSTTDLTHPAAQRAASGQLRRISPHDVSDLSSSPSAGSSPASSRAPSAGGDPSLGPSGGAVPVESGGYLRAGSGSLRIGSGYAASPPFTPSARRRPPIAPLTEDNPLRTQSADRSLTAQSAILAYTAGLRRRSATHNGPPSPVPEAADDDGNGSGSLEAVSSYVENLRSRSQKAAAMGEARRCDQIAAAMAGSASHGDAVSAASGSPTKDVFSAGSLQAGSVFEDESARDAVAAYRAARAQMPRGGRRRASPPLLPPVIEPPTSAEAEGQSSGAPTDSKPSVSRASTTRRVADKSAEAVTAARSMVDDYMASLQTRSLAALNSQRPPRPDSDIASGSGDGGEAQSQDAACAKTAVDDYLAGLRSRSLAAARSRASPAGASGPPMLGGHSAVAASLRVDSRSNNRSPPPPPQAAGAGLGGSGDARTVVDSYMQSLRQCSAAVVQQRAGAAVSPEASTMATASEAAGDDGQAAVASYMKSLRRQSVAAAATAAARRSSQDRNAEIAAKAAAPAEAEARGDRDEPEPKTTAPKDSQSMREAREAVAAHMASLRQRSASMRDSAAMRATARSAGQTSSEPAGKAALDVARPASAGQQPNEQEEDELRCRSASAPASVVHSAADAEAAESSTGAPDGGGGDAKAVVDSYIASLRRTSQAVARPATTAAAVPPTDAESSRTSGVGDARAKLDSYMASVRRTSSSVAGSCSAQPSADTARSSGGSDPRAAVDCYIASLRRTSASIGAGASLHAASASGDGGSPPGAAAAKPPVDTARTAVDSYMDSLRRTSAQLGGAGGTSGASLRAGSLSGAAGGGSGAGALDLRAIAAGAGDSGTPPRPPSSKRSSNDSDGSGGSGSGGSHEDARSAVANYMENLQSRAARQAGALPAGTSVRSSGSLRAGSLRLASIQLDPVQEDVAAGALAEGVDTSRQSVVSGEDPTEAAAEKSETEAYKVVATYIDSLKRTSQAATGDVAAKPKTAIRVDFGGDAGPTVALASSSATTSSMSAASSVGFTDSSGSGAAAGAGAANAVSAYMASLKARATAAAAEGRGPSGGPSGGGGGAPLNAAGRSQAASAPDAKSVVDAYLADLKSRSAQAAVLRQTSTSTAGGGGASRSPSVAASSLRSPSGYPSSLLRIGSDSPGSLDFGSVRVASGLSRSAEAAGDVCGSGPGGPPLETLQEAASGELSASGDLDAAEPTARSNTSGRDTSATELARLPIAEEPQAEDAAAAESAAEGAASQRAAGASPGAAGRAAAAAPAAAPAAAEPPGDGRQGQATTARSSSRRPWP